MIIQHQNRDSKGIRVSIKNEEKEIASAYVYILTNDLHKEPFAFLENLFVDESARGQGFGTALIQEVIQTAKEHGCYKLICTSRHKNQRVHELYEKLGFREQGKEFRMDL